MGMSTAFADHSSNTNALIDRLSMYKINNGTGIRGMNLTVFSGMTNRTFFRFR